MYSLHEKSESWDEHIRKCIHLIRKPLVRRHQSDCICLRLGGLIAMPFHSGILKVITEMFLPHIGLKEVEACLSKVLPKVNIIWLHQCCVYCPLLERCLTPWMKFYRYYKGLQGHCLLTFTWTGNFCIPHMLSLFVGCHHVRQFDEGDLKPSRRTVQSKHRVAYPTEKTPGGALLINIINYAFYFMCFSTEEEISIQKWFQRKIPNVFK